MYGTLQCNVIRCYKIESWRSNHTCHFILPSGQQSPELLTHSAHWATINEGWINWDSTANTTSLCLLYMEVVVLYGSAFNTLRPRQNGRHFADDIFKCIFLNENVWILIKILLKFVPKDPINNIPALVQIMALHHPGNKPLSEPITVSSPMHMSHSASMS